MKLILTKLKVIYIINETEDEGVIKMAEMLARVHTQGNLINKKEISMKDALLMLYRKDR